MLEIIGKTEKRQTCDFLIINSTSVPDTVIIFKLAKIKV